MGFFSKRETGDGEGREVKISRTGNPTARPVLVRIWGMVGCLLITLAFIALIIVIQKKLPDGSKSSFHPTWKRDLELGFLSPRQNDTILTDTILGTIPPTPTVITDAPTFTTEPAEDCVIKTVICSEKLPEGCYTTFVRGPCTSTDSPTTSSILITPPPTIIPTPTPVYLLSGSCLTETVSCLSESICYTMYNPGPCSSTPSESVPIPSDTIISPPSSTSSTIEITSIPTESVPSPSDTITLSPSSTNSTTEITSTLSEYVPTSSDTITSPLFSTSSTIEITSIPNESVPSPSNTITSPPSSTSSTNSTREITSIPNESVPSPSDTITSPPISASSTIEITSIPNESVPSPSDTVTSPPFSASSTIEITSTLSESVPTSSDTITSPPSSASSTTEMTSSSIMITAPSSSASDTTLESCLSETIICPSESSCYDTLMQVPCTVTTTQQTSSTIESSISSIIITAPPSSASSTTLVTCFSETLICPSESSCYDALVPVLCATTTSSSQASSTPDTATTSSQASSTTEACVSKTLLCPSDSSCYIMSVPCTSSIFSSTSTLLASSSTTSMVPPSTITSVTSTIDSCVTTLEDCYLTYNSEIDDLETVCETDYLTMTGTACVTNYSMSVFTPTSIFETSSLSIPTFSPPYCMSAEVSCFEDELPNEEFLVTVCTTSYVTRTDAECGTTSSLLPAFTPTPAIAPSLSISSTGFQPTSTFDFVTMSVNTCLSTDISCNTFYPTASVGAAIAEIGGFATATETPEPVIDCTTTYASIAGCSSSRSLSSSSSSVYVSSSSNPIVSSSESSEVISSTLSRSSIILVSISTSQRPVLIVTASSETTTLSVSSITPSTTSASASISVHGTISSIISSLTSIRVSTLPKPSTDTASRNSISISQSKATKPLINLVTIDSSISISSLTPTTSPAVVSSPNSSVDWFFSPPIVSSSAAFTPSSVISSTRSLNTGSITPRPSIIQGKVTSTEALLSSTRSPKSSSTYLKSSTLVESSLLNSHISSHRSSVLSKSRSSKSSLSKPTVSKSTVSKSTVLKSAASTSTASKSISNVSAEPQISVAHTATSIFGSVAPSASASAPTNNITDLSINSNPSIYPISKVVVGNYVPLITARVFTSLLTPFYNGILLFEPIRQLTNPNGAPYAALAGSSAIEIPIHIAMLVANLGSGFAAGATFLDISYCQAPPCTPKLSANPWVLDVMIATIAIQALAITFLITQWWRKPSGLSADPTSIAGVAVVMGHPKIEADFQSIPADMTASELKRRLRGERYKLGTFMTAAGLIKFGVMPAPINPSRSVRIQRGPGFFARIMGSIPFIDSWRNNKLYFDAFFLMFLLALLGLTCAALSHINKPQVVFLATAAASGTGMRIFLAVLGVIVSTYWGRLFRDMQTFAPYVGLGRGDAEPDPTVLLHKHTFPITAFFPLLFKGHYTAASVAVTGLAAEFLILALAGMPYRPGQARGEFLFWSCISLFILIFMVIQLLLVVSWRRKLPVLARAPDTIASVMAYVAGTGMARDFEGLSTMGTKERDGMVRGWGKRYVYGWRREGAEGRVRWVVDDIGTKDVVVNGEGLRRTDSF